MSSSYRLYFMDPDSGHIERFAEFEAPDDQSAIALAGEHIGRNPLELWCERRKVGRINAFDTGPRRSENIIERAFQLARSGECRALGDIHAVLKREGFLHVQAHLDGPSLRRQLNSLMADAGGAEPGMAFPPRQGEG
jgi:hypothetical protein